MRAISMAALGLLTAQAVISVILKYTHQQPLLVTGLSTLAAGSTQSQVDGPSTCHAITDVDLDWYPSAQWEVNDLDAVIRGPGTFGFVFNTSQGPVDAYNWCNMPHVNPRTYPSVDARYRLEYVEVIHRHHKRTPYAANTFPVETQSWQCDDEGLRFGGKPINPSGNGSAATYWSVFTSPANPLTPHGFSGSCQFPQITRGGLDDSFQHGVDLKAVYHNKLHFLPDEYDAAMVSYRVTNNVITSQVASMLVAGMWPERRDVDTPLLVQPSSIDSLEPGYSCGLAGRLRDSYGPGGDSPAWMRHISLAATLKARLDAVSGVDPDARDWKTSYDHYFDNLSSRLCHDMALPCSAQDGRRCVSQDDADEVFRLGEYEYSFLYRDAGPDTLRASVASYGIWIAELAQHLRDAADRDATGATSPRYRHNVAHDGSMARLLAVLQVERMVWPGMGAEVVFELYRGDDDGCHYLRVLWGGQLLRSSHPLLGEMDMLPLGTVLAYFDGLVGAGASKIPAMCAS